MHVRFCFLDTHLEQIDNGLRNKVILVYNDFVRFCFVVQTEIYVIHLYSDFCSVMHVHDDRHHHVIDVDYICLYILLINDTSLHSDIEMW